MRSTGVLALSLAALVFGAAVSPAQAVTFLVDDNYASESATHFQTIQHAIDAVTTSGTTIKVAKGTYDQTVVVDKSVKLLGHSANDTFVNTSSASQPGIIVIAPNVTLSGFTVRGGTNTLVAGIIVGGDSWGDPTDYGVSGVVVQKCTVEKSAVGILVWRSTGTRILNNIVRSCVGSTAGTATGITVGSDGSFDLTGTQLIGNRVYDSDSYGISVTGNGSSLDGTKIANNTLYNNGARGDLPPNNNNSAGFFFSRATGSITITGNKLRASPDGTLLNVDSTAPGVPGITSSGNKIYPVLNPAKLTGTPTTRKFP